MFVLMSHDIDMTCSCSVDSTEPSSAYTQYLSRMLNMAAGLDDSVCHPVAF